jgi:hypothetical protein
MSEFSISGGADAQLLKWEYIDAQGRRVVSLIDQETYDALVRSGRIKPNDQAKPGPIGNTQGIIVPDTSPNTSGSSSAPEPSPTEAEKGWWKRWGSGATHGVLDVIGMIPVIGEPANLIGAGIYALEGDYTSAALDLAAMWPAGGQAATVAKNARNVGGAVLEQAEKRAAREAAEAAERRAVREAEERAAREAQEQAQRRADNAAPPKKKDEGGNIKGDPRCVLRPYRPDTCPPRMTGHHVVPDRVFRVGSRGSARIPGGIPEADGLVICVKGANTSRANEHGRIHQIYDTLERTAGLAGTPVGTAQLAVLEAAGATAVAQITGCSAAAMTAQLRAFHQSKGLGATTLVRADPTGRLPIDFTKLGVTPPAGPGR